MAKKSLYVFLTSVLGVLLFLILHRVAVFIYLYFMVYGHGGSNLNYFQFLAWDYFTLLLALMAGSWYGIWLGLNWYKQIYEDNSHGGLVHHLATKIFNTRSPKSLSSKINVIKEKLEADLEQMESLSKTAMEMNFKPEPIKRTVVRKKPIKKINVVK